VLNTIRAKQRQVQSQRDRRLLGAVHAERGSPVEKMLAEVAGSVAGPLRSPVAAADTFSSKLRGIEQAWRLQSLGFQGSRNLP